jgi:hypothetical protein
MAAKFGKNFYAAGGEAFRGGKGIVDRKLYDQIGAAGQCSFCSGHLIKDSWVSPLNKITAHQANNGMSLGVKKVDLFLVSVMQWIIFTDYTGNYQN